MGKPKIRFRGYTDDWEQRKLADVLTLLKDGTHGTHKDAESGPLLLSAKNIKNGTVQWDESDRRISEDEYNSIHSNFQLQNGDVLLTIVGSIGETAILSQSKGVTFQRSVAFLRPSDDMSSEFLYSEIQGQRFQKELNDRKSTSAQPGIYLGDLGAIPIEFPTSGEEQNKIGSYFQNLDHLITLHQRKCEETRRLKQYMLQKMFPQDGRCVPEIRFAGFTEDWEQRKLGEVYTERNERGNDSLQILSVSIHSGVSDGELDAENLGKTVRRSEDKSTYKHVYEGDLIFNMMRAWQGAIGVAKSEGMISPAYISAIPSENLYPLFMNYLLRRKEIIGQINNLSYGVTDFRKRLYWDSFVKVVCNIPSVEEQKKIAEYFDSLDHLITLHQRKLEILKKIKKYFLKKMFAEIVLYSGG